MNWRRFRSALVGGAVVALLTATLTACSPGRSVEAYCGVIAEHKERYLAAMGEVNAGDNPLAGMVGMVSALGDLNRMWEEAAKVAPEEIQADVEAVRDAWASQFEAAERAASDPLGGLASALMTGLQAAAATQRVDEYTAQNCPDVGGMFVG